MEKAPRFNALEQARLDADQERARYMDFMADDRGHVDPVAAQGMATYLENRPSQDDEGKVHHPATGEFINPDVYFAEQRTAHEKYSQTRYEDMGVLEIARLLAKAELSEDRTATENLSDVLLDKLAEAAEKTSGVVSKERTEGYGAHPDIPAWTTTETSTAAQDALWDRVLGYKDSYKEKLEKGAQTDMTPEDFPSAEPEQPDESETPPTPEETEPKPEEPPTGATKEVETPTEEKEKSRDELIDEVDDLLEELVEKGNIGSRPAQLLKPVKKYRKPHLLTNDLINVPELLNVRAPKSSGYDNLTKHRAFTDNLKRRVRGFLKDGSTNAWVIPTRAKPPRPEYFEEREQPERYKPWSNHLLITPDGEIYTAFVYEPEKRGKNKKIIENEKYLVDESNPQGLEDLSIAQIRTIKDYLAYHLSKVQGSKNGSEGKPIAAGAAEVHGSENEHANGGPEEELAAREAELRQAESQVNSTEEELGEARKKGLQLMDKLKGTAIWKNGGSSGVDRPVEITGYWGVYEGRHYMKIKDSDVGVPLDELEFGEDTVNKLNEIFKENEEDEEQPS